MKSQGRRRKKGEDCPSEASSADPDGNRGDEPNSPITAGASWFVLLAVEKNEQINDLFQPLSSETAVPSVSPLYFPTETQGRRIIVFCISVFGVVQMSRGEIR